MSLMQLLNQLHGSGALKNDEPTGNLPQSAFLLMKLQKDEFERVT